MQFIEGAPAIKMASQQSPVLYQENEIIGYKDNICMEIWKVLQEQMKQSTSVRFANLTKNEVEKIAAARTSKHTDHQTHWGVKIFRGKQLLTIIFVIISYNTFEIFG